MRNKYFFVLILFIAFFELHAQEIKIISVDKKSEFSYTYLIINCEIINDTDSDIILPLQNSAENNYYIQLFNYTVSTRKKNVFKSRESPPPPIWVPNLVKFSKESVLNIPSKSSTSFSIATNKFPFRRVYKDKNQIKKIRIIYSPQEFDNRDIHFEEDLQDLQFYTKEIKSKYFKLK
ncbi:hypothetical protein [Frigoriflavimonas asaccharolytica]|uniref:Uncharacterized protein n=1 Tax=Frigoriflavimonas asaccharolytica TaxID=2735899 RepID=A0A8J8K7S7_9FLAO|nr:hypothetical protein [Frigoriflavimonas asaccharolytica]NRS91786.1 hypothetical protein [Frigoriflavimonas asaccharolytica]